MENCNYKSELGRNHMESSLDLGRRADELLVAVATLGLVATVVDGEPDQREINSFSSSFREKFALSRNQSHRIIGMALKRVSASEENIIEVSCDALNEYLTTAQKLDLFESLSDVLLADSIVRESEQEFLEYVALRLGIVDALRDELTLNAGHTVK